jgi:ABC-type amino acid transport substrate-binding protein
VGTDPTYPPFETLRDGKVVGYDAELAQAIAADLGVRVEFQTLALDTLYDALAAGKVDVLVSALPFVYERQRDIRYSAPYYQAGQVLLVRVGDVRITSISDLGGKRIGVELGSNADTEARRLARSTVQGMKLQSTYHSPGDALSALAGGQLDAAITDNVSAWAYLRDHPRTLGILPITITDEPYVVAMPVQATGLGARVDATIGRLRASGELARMMRMELAP